MHLPHSIRIKEPGKIPRASSSCHLASLAHCRVGAWPGNCHKMLGKGDGKHGRKWGLFSPVLFCFAVCFLFCLRSSRFSLLVQFDSFIECILWAGCSMACWTQKMKKTKPLPLWAHVIKITCHPGEAYKRAFFPLKVFSKNKIVRHCKRAGQWGVIKRFGPGEWPWSD